MLALSASFRRLVVFGTTLTDQGLAHVRYTAMLVPRFGLDAFAQTEFDTLARLAQRSVAGGGVRAVVWSSDAVGLWLGTRVMGEVQRWDVPVSSPFAGAELAWRSTSYGSVRLASGALVVTDTAYLQPRLDDPADVHLTNELGVAVAALPHLSFTTTFASRYSSRVPAGVAEVDLGLRSGIAVTY